MAAAPSGRNDAPSGMTYADYLQLDAVLDAQRPLSDAPDEMLFIVQHQTSELWMKLILYELSSARAAICADRMPQAFKLLTRVARIFEQLNSAWDVLRTMTPSEYTQFREALGESSGFQSLQYRLIEFTLGNRDPGQIAIRRERADAAAQLSLFPEGHEEAARFPESLGAVRIELGRRPSREVRLERRSGQVKEIFLRLLRECRRHVAHGRTPAGAAARGNAERKSSTATANSSSLPSKK